MATKLNANNGETRTLQGGIGSIQGRFHGYIEPNLNEGEPIPTEDNAWITYRTNGDCVLFGEVYSNDDPNRPIVLNFGSCTWTPFVRNISKFLRISKEFKDRAGIDSCLYKLVAVYVYVYVYFCV